MTKHRDDHNLWSMYMIIDNLNRKIKWSQKKFNIIMMNLISIVKFDDEHKSFIQHKVYHQIMKFIFKRA